MFLLLKELRTNIVRTIPNAQITLDLKNLESFPICILSDIFDIIPSDVPISISGKKTEDIIFPIKVIITRSTG